MRGTLRSQVRRPLPAARAGAGRDFGDQVARWPADRRTPVRSRRAAQDSSGGPGAERHNAGQLWNDGDWLFATPAGGALNPRTDWDDWKKLLVKAGVRDGRLHDARHTAATVLLLLGVPERAVMSIMGWSHTAMATRYQHVTGAIQRDIADRVGGLIWQVEDPSGRATETGSRNAGRVRVDPSGVSPGEPGGSGGI
ncbi:MAG TPA: tyrosine-type recombinase/integrase [Actinomadura sp.]|nr:tyrosine-type recombinase/integrase [Actinomadura sp.]